ncbi:family 16 glycosylhydrolase [Dysgonomonas macrotermitis]|uniref:Putative binding domain-containing protein, N-terminal n=1 Tax=Dysgonomonas macrotermitis TaxID=1346286 RepID=A0A1M4TNF1_9BACT|nr:family 16 glycosylhydrolase [Dysgonomonas macrotermitis]SHE45991.1 Putative binding domain-containing protein, N-terminal [Dysgonomonas macrotermitis]
MNRILNKLTIFTLLFSLASCSNGSSNEDSGVVGTIACTPTEISVGYATATQTLEVVASGEWSAFSNESWITCSPTGSVDTKGTVTVTIAANTSTAAREGSVVLKCGTTRVTVPVKQTAKPESPGTEIPTPDGYKLVWYDEFDEGTEPSADWWYETGGGGWGNNELQNYVAGYQGLEQLAAVKDGVLTITAKKIDDKVYSIRMNTSQSWKYGYFEARLKLPSGKGTWPAFWMMPKNYTSWPADGEIDIMEEVGYRPNYVSSAIHCTSYNHSIGTEKTGETYLSTSQTEYHVYALEWTEDYIRTYVDGKELFYFANDKKGNKDTWPFDAAFYLKLNLAWGGNWGGAEGVDESVLPATYSIDYVRVFQKQ